MQKLSSRVNGHRSHFKADNVDAIEKSAFSLHAHEQHPDDFSLVPRLLYNGGRPKYLRITQHLLSDCFQTNSSLTHHSPCSPSNMPIVVNFLKTLSSILEAMKHQ